jgi:hypothetical protein
MRYRVVGVKLSMQYVQELSSDREVRVRTETHSVTKRIGAVWGRRQSRKTNYVCLEPIRHAGAELDRGMIFATPGACERKHPGSMGSLVIFSLLLS